MTNDDDLLTPSSEWEAMIQAAVDELIAQEDPQDFLSWMQETMPKQFRGALPPTDARMLRQVATKLAYTIAAAVPLPATNFRPRPLPPPKRNDPCPCGSGRKYKQCCAHLPAFPDLEPTELLPYVIDRLDADQLREAVRRGGVPQEALAMIAVRELDEDKPRRAAELLEPVFAGPLDRLDERHGYALNVLCDSYDALGWWRKKEALLAAVGREAKRPLQSEAWQRRATWQVDQGDLAGAWASFRKAQQAGPDDPSLAILEVTLLMAEGRKGEAADRAAFWRKRLERLNVGDERILVMLDAISADPDGGLADAYMGVTAPGIDRLRAWLEANAGRPIAAYDVLPLEKVELDGARLLMDQGAEVDLRDDEQVATDEGVPADHALARVLVAPEALPDIEDEWIDVFPVDDPFGLPLDGVDDEDPWEPEVADEWLGFLANEPAAFDDLAILDDLATLVEAIPTAQTPWSDEAVLRPILERGKAIVDRSLELVTEPFTLPWVVLDNRPALSLLTRWAFWLMRRGDPEAAAGLERVLRLDPEDRQGLRGELMNHYLRIGDDARALTLSERSGSDVLPELPYGRVLALYRTGRLDEARDALRTARKHLPKVGDYLVKPSVGQPKMAPFGITIGGDDQAWLYREAMLDTWRAVPGLLAWLAGQIRGRR